MSAVAQLLVPSLSDWCGVDLIEGAQLKRVAIAHVDPTKIELVAEIERLYPVDLTEGHGVAEVVRSGRPEYIVEITPEMLAGAAKDKTHLDLVERLQLRSFICVPLQIRGRVLGAISMAMAESGRRYTENDFQLATALADRSALAIENSRLFKEAKTAHELAAAARDESEQTFKLMVQSVKDYAICMLDPGGHVMSWNDGAQLIKGYTRDEILGSHFSCFYPSDARAAGKCELMLALAKERGSIQDEGWRIRKDGARFRAYVVLTAVRDDAGELKGFAKVTRDLTEQTLSREALAAEAAKREEAEQQAKFIETFVAILGHDLRNPLNAIAIGTELLKAEGKATSNVLERVSNSTQRMSRMVSQLLDLTRTRLAGGIPIERKPTDLGAIVRRVVEELRLAHPERQILVHGSSHVPGEWDGDRLEQVVSNLVSNAIEHGEPGPPIDVALNASDLDASVAVTNFGPPIPPEAIDVLFDPFRQVENRSNAKARGLGLGLFITKQIVNGHGGIITCRSNAAEGTTFLIVLPRA